MGGELIYKIIQRIEGVTGIKELLILTVAALDLDAAACIPRFQSAKKIGRRIGGLLWVDGEKPKARELVNGGVVEQAKLRIRNALTWHNLRVHPDALAGMGPLLIRLGNIGFFLLLSRKQAHFAHHAEQTFWAAGVPAPPQAVPQLD